MSVPSVEDDAQLAADMQLAYDMQAAESEAHRRQRIMGQEERLLRRQQQEMLDQMISSPPASRRKQQPASNRYAPPPAGATSGGRSGTGRRRQQIPVVQGQPIESGMASTSASAPSSVSSSLTQTVTTDGFLQHQNQNLIYVPAEINERPVEMMVDTGAQSSVISAQLMRKLGLESRLNTRMQGVAQGVGRANILGIVENCPAQIGHVEFMLYFMVLDIPQDMIIFGIDQMRRFKCVIDLEEDKLIFGGKEGVAVSFFPPEMTWMNARNQAMNENCTISNCTIPTFLN